MEKNCNQPKSDATKPASITWASQGLMVDVYKTIDSDQPPIKIDLASTLGVSSKLPLAVKKAVRYWFDPSLKTKTDVVKYLNKICRGDGFKISTLSNSKQGLDRRAQLVCSRGIVARKPRGKSQIVQTTTSRPVTHREKCPFSFTVYECRKTGRWYLRKFGNGSRMHCGHCRLQPDQVGVRRYQNLTERVGSEWCEVVQTPPTEDTCASDTTKTPENEPNVNIDPKRAINHPDPKTGTPAKTSPQSNPKIGWSPKDLDKLVQRVRKQNQQEIMGYMSTLRERIIQKDYNERLLLERARRFREVDKELDRLGSQNNSAKSIPPNNNHYKDARRNGALGLSLEEPIRPLPQKTSANNNGGGLVQHASGNNDPHEQIQRLINQMGTRELMKILKQKEGGKCDEERVRDLQASENVGGKIPNQLDTGQKGENDIRIKDSRIVNPSISHNFDQNRFAYSSNMEMKASGDRYNDDRKRTRNSDDVFRTSQPKKVHQEESLSDIVSNLISNHDLYNTESPPKIRKIDSYANSIVDQGQHESIRSNFHDNEISNHRSGGDDGCLPETVGSNECTLNATDGSDKQLGDSIEKQKPTVAEDCLSPDPCDENTDTYEDFGDEYAMLRPMAFYDHIYPPL